MAKVVDEETAKACMEYIREHPKEYSIVGFLKDKNLFIDADTSGGELKIKCPFHPDAKPSLGIDEEENVCYCFSCNNGGDYLKYTYLLHKKVLGTSLGFYSILNNLLIGDTAMRIALGKTSILLDKKVSLTELKSFKSKSFKKSDERRIRDFGDLKELMVGGGYTDMASIRHACLYAQQGYDPESIYKALNNEQVAVSVQDQFSSFDLEEILANESFVWEGFDDGDL